MKSSAIFEAVQEWFSPATVSGFGESEVAEVVESAVDVAVLRRTYERRLRHANSDIQIEIATGVLNAIESVSGDEIGMARFAMTSKAQGIVLFRLDDGRPLFAFPLVNRPGSDAR